MKKKIILYIHHVGSRGGSTNSLIEMISGMKIHDRRFLIVPRGSAADVFENIFDKVIFVPGIPQFDNTEFGYYRGWRWFILIRELIYFLLCLPIFLKFLITHASQIRLIHFNEITLIPLSIVASFFKLKIIFHVRSLQRLNYRNKFLFNIFSDVTFLPIDEYVAATLPEEANTLLCRNSFSNNKTLNVKNFKEHLNKKCLNAVILGGEPYQKGIDLALMAIQGLREEHKVNINISVFGMSPTGSLKSRFRRLISRSYRDCLNVIEQCENEEWVRFYDFSNNTDTIFKEKNLLLFTTRLKAPGRPVIEACFYGIPSIYCTDAKISNCFDLVANYCSPDATRIKTKILEMINGFSISPNRSDFDQIIREHSYKVQSKILENVYGVELCEK